MSKDPSAGIIPKTQQRQYAGWTAATGHARSQVDTQFVDCQLVWAIKAGVTLHGQPQLMIFESRLIVA